MKYTRLSIVAALLCSSIAPASAQQNTAAPFLGYWLGTLRAGVLDLRMLLRVQADATGKLSTTMTSLDQGGAVLPADSTLINGAELRAVFLALQGSFRGTVDSQKRLTGTLTQGAIGMPLVFVHTDGPPRVARPQTPVAPFPYRSDSVNFTNVKAGITLGGTLTTPNTQGTHPAVVLISGSGPQDRDGALFDHKPFLVIADYLTRRGIAVLRVDDRGVGSSGGNPGEATTEDFSDDALAAVAFLKSRRGIDAAHIGLIGHSEGGLIAPLASTRSKDVAFVVMLAGPGLPGHEISMLQARALSEAAGAPPASIDFNMALQRRTLDILMKYSDEATIRREIDVALREELTKVGASTPETLTQLRNQIDPQIKLALLPWSRFFMMYDPRPTLQKVTVPVLALNGDKDRQVPAAVNLAEISKALTAGGNRNFKTVSLPSLNHLFQTAPTGAVSEYGTIQETFAPVALAAMGDWILLQVRKP